MKEEVKNWMKIAREDYNTAKANFEIKKYRFASYLCQQAIEKALKALLIKKTGKIIKIHDLVRLGKEVGIEEKFFDSLEKISYVYIDSRYPDIPHREYNQEEADEDIKIAEEILKWIEENL